MCFCFISTISEPETHNNLVFWQQLRHKGDLKCSHRECTLHIFYLEPQIAREVGKIRESLPHLFKGHLPDQISPVLFCAEFQQAAVLQCNFHQQAQTKLSVCVITY